MLAIMHIQICCSITATTVIPTLHSDVLPAAVIRCYPTHMGTCRACFTTYFDPFSKACLLSQTRYSRVGTSLHWLKQQHQIKTQQSMQNSSASS